MIVAKDKPTNLTHEEYFIWEEQQLQKHECHKIKLRVHPIFENS